MKSSAISLLVKFTGRFVIVHFIVYLILSIPFQFLVARFPGLGGESLDFYRPFEALGFLPAAGEIIRSCIIGLMLYPLRKQVIDSKRGALVLFGILFGVILLGSVEPKPGSIEGIIYTVTSTGEHLAVIVTGALHALLVSVAFIRWERGNVPGPMELETSPYSMRKALNFSTRFILLHIVTYVAMGILFMNLQDYAAAFEELELFAMFRPLDDPIVAFAMLFQVPRGLLLALCIFPFHGLIVEKKRGWLLLFGIMIIFTNFASYTLPNLLLFLAERDQLHHLLTGYAEVTVQMAVFSLLLFAWEKRRVRRKNRQGD